MVFKGETSQKPTLVIASGPNRACEKTMKNIIGESLDKANANWVLEQTGYTIGGIPPFAHNVPIDTYIDEDLLAITQGKIVSVKG